MDVNMKIYIDMYKGEDTDTGMDAHTDVDMNMYIYICIM